MRDNVASSAGKRMYSASPRGIMVSAVMGGGRRVVQFCYNICVVDASRPEVVTVYDVGAGMITTYVDYGMKISIVVM